jgi:hypothetical protein
VLRERAARLLLTGRENATGAQPHSAEHELSVEPHALRSTLLGALGLGRRASSSVSSKILQAGDVPDPCEECGGSGGIGSAWGVHG